MGGNLPPKLGHEFGFLAAAEIGLHPILQHDGAQFLRAGDGIAREVLVYDVGEGASAPEREGSRELRRRDFGPTLAKRLSPLLGETLESVEVELTLSDPEQIPGSTRYKDLPRRATRTIRLQGLAELRDVDLKRVGSALGRLLAP